MKIIRMSILICMMCLWCTPAPGMKALSSAEMDAVRAGAGVSLSLRNFRMYRFDEYLTYTATEGDPIYGETLFQLTNILYNDNNTGTFWQWNDQISGATFHTSQPVTIDVFNNEYKGGQPMLALQMPAFWQELYIMSESVSFCGVELGPMNFNYPVAESAPGAFALYTTPLDSGIGLQLELGTVIEQLRLRYHYRDRILYPNTPEEHFLTLGDLHIGGYIDGGGNVAGNFRIGDLNPRGMGTYNPMEIHVARETRTYEDENGQPYDQNVTFLRLEMPMQGSIRLGTLEIGPDYGLQTPTDFGVIHIDGIQAHRMTVDFIAGREDI